MNKRLEDWVNWILYDELKNGVINAPKHLLGNHVYGDGQVITVYRPYAEKVCVVSPTGKNREEMECLAEGFYGFYSAKKKYKGTKYRIETTYQDGTTVVTADAYAFDSQITEFDTYLFAEGKHYDVYEKFGAHPMTIDGVKGTYFAVWAPHARRVSVVGDFNMWDGALNPMQMMQTSGIYELFIPDVAPGAVYKYQILTRDGEILYKADPYGNQCQVRPDNANVVADLTGYKWKDTDWIENRKQQTRETELKKPMAIYECHLGSWKKKIEDSDFGFYTYRELAKMLCDYVKKMGYTHVELMGIAEYPFDGSWGYQVTNYYAPTSRYGSPEDFMYFVDHMHANGIGVILDWVPAHFPRDAHGLGRFDGMPLYEHPDPRRGEHPDWGTYIFDFGRNEVSNFLTANALFWVEKFHVDALRVDAVASMLYLDYGKQDGQWLPNKDGGNENYDAIELLRKINTVMEERNPGAFLIAEESTAWAGVTAPASMKGLGFLYKWNMGWMNDFLEYMKMDPYFRSFNHNRLTFSLSYTYAENYVLVISHDEVVHLKCSMLNKMPGVEMDKFANLRTAYGFMYGHPGKKLLFMGQEFGQLREWSEARSLDWFLLDQPLHKKMQKWVADLNHMYTTYDACYYNDNNQMGFEWTKVDDANTSIIAFVRRGKTVKDQLLFVCNFVPVERKDYWIGVPCLTEYEEIINSDAKIYGGSGTKNGKVKAFEEKCDRMPYAISIDIAPLSMMVFRYDYVDKKPAIAKKAAVARTSTENKSVEKKTTK
ncbi:1,4-alpha-glucan branching protein GlgB [Coprococcus sp. CLA-AA-H212]|jgi:1,4-alpha-glucan branching enzyme|uniref:1,4-alpha-glucan branching enzyme GlgB n=1 Tax=Coprococcus hominis (ex Arizal et al. 2022) TaxID=2881262 RepID=A0ABS8FRM1_9FIRM|nr:1,4-alpha-glucan branching protein GlgB [Coprococcus hominis (ex Arizal et al. 2022)]MCC2219827.1 1,4-alpha-glucan branching protein GlgB [Coprococcus hominis (ex Arizal et al. 2022)]RHQ68759.1 1,4-alpha-glucan branching protein GlgB [Clostridium sp. AF23-8]